MRKPFAFITTVALCCLFFPSAARAQTNTIQISNQSVGTGSITVSGTYTTATGWSVSSITVYAWLSTGGPQSLKSTTYTNGNWPNTTISSLTSNKAYTVYAQMIVMNGTQSATINSGPTLLTPN